MGLNLFVDWGWEMVDPVSYPVYACIRLTNGNRLLGVIVYIILHYVDSQVSLLPESTGK